MTPHERRYERLRFVVHHRLRKLVLGKTPKEAKEACRYVLSGGGKRVRSTLLMLSCEAVGGKVRDSVNAGTAVELMHDFTLVHDDIMDNASARRGRPTVHTKWNVNNALLVGDILLGLAYKQLLKTRSSRLDRILDVFTTGLLDVCEGQAFDLEFERSATVTLRDYFKMIEKKTARLISTSTQIGGLIGGGSEREIISLEEFGCHLGRAFQLQDDLLDAIGEEKNFGKQIGGDIIEGKKTFLLLKALERARAADRMVLMQVMNRRFSFPIASRSQREREVRRVTALYRTTGAIDAAARRIQAETSKAESALERLPESRAKETMLWLSQMLLKRNF